MLSSVAFLRQLPWPLQLVTLLRMLMRMVGGGGGEGGAGEGSLAEKMLYESVPPAAGFTSSRRLHSFADQSDLIRHMGSQHWEGCTWPGPSVRPQQQDWTGDPSLTVK